jgi:hypothetical protein
MARSNAKKSCYSSKRCGAVNRDGVATPSVMTLQLRVLWHCSSRRYDASDYDAMALWCCNLHRCSVVMPNDIALFGNDGEQR